MFDHLRVHPDLLPVSAEEKSLLARSCSGDFQTKSLQRSLTLVEITTDGRLLWASFDKEPYLSEDDLPQDYLLKEGEEFLLLMGGFEVPLRKITWIEEKNYSGGVRFYDDIADKWYEFCAHFSNGRLSTIEKLSPLAAPNETVIV